MSEKKENGKEKDSVFSVLSAVDCTGKTEKKGQFTYLSWAHAVAELLSRYPGAEFGCQEYPDGKPYISTPAGCFVRGYCKLNDVTRVQIHPVLDNNNRPVKEPNCFQINTSIQRAITKAIALWGLGLYIYAGEDLPGDMTEEATQKPQNAPLKAQTATRQGQDSDRREIEGVVSVITYKDFEKKDGSIGRRYGLKVGDTWYNTFSDTVAETKKGSMVRFFAVRNAKGFNDIVDDTFMAFTEDVKPEEPQEVQF